MGDPPIVTFSLQVQHTDSMKRIGEKWKASATEVKENNYPLWLYGSFANTACT